MVVNETDSEDIQDNNENKKTDQNPKTVNSSNYWGSTLKWYLIILVGVILVFSVVAFDGGVLSMNQNAATGKVVLDNPLTKTCKIVKTPYEVQESYIEQEPYTDYEQYDVDLKYQVISAVKGDKLDGLDYKTTFKVLLKNMDSETGTPFKVIAYFETLEDGEMSQDKTSYVMSGETGQFYFVYNSEYGEDIKVRYKVVPGEKTLTRQVTKYRDVTKYRTVTKYREEEVCS